MQRAPEAVIEIGPVDYLIEFCLNEIALQGLEGTATAIKPKKEKN